MLEAFPIDCLEKFKHVVDILVSMLTWRGRKVELTMLNTTIERIKTFFEQMKQKIQYQNRGSALMTSGFGSKSSSTTQATASYQDLKEYQFSGNMVQYLDHVVSEASLDLNAYLGDQNGVILCRCYASCFGTTDTIEYSNIGDKIFQINSAISYEEL